MSQAYNHHHQTMHITQPSQNPFSSPRDTVEYTDEVGAPATAPWTVVETPPAGTRPPHIPGPDAKPPTTVISPNSQGNTTQPPSSLNLPFNVPQSVQVTLSAAMRILGDQQVNEPSARQAWYARADNFDPAAPRAPSEEAQPGRSSGAVRAVKDVGKGMAILVGVPVAIAGAAIVGTGGMLYGVGLMLKGLGGALTCGLGY